MEKMREIGYSKTSYKAQNNSSFLISIIVPVYNVEPYLRQCLDSIINQTYKNIEIILVDDGSPDHCGEICDEYAQKDSRIIVIHQENAGLSAARNVALDIARGEYIMFVDSDDWVEPTFCEKALEMILEHQVEIASFGCIYIYKNKNIRIKTESPRIVEREEAIKHIVLADEKAIGNGVWNKIYHRRLFQNIRFTIGKIYEDIDITYKLIHLVSRLYLSDSAPYYYRIRKNSLSGSMNRNKVINRCHAFIIKYERLSFLKKRYPIPSLIEHQTLCLSKIAINTMKRLNKKNPEERKTYNLMKSFFKENKEYLLSIPCDKYTRLFLHSKPLCYTYMSLAKFKSNLFLLFQNHSKKKNEAVEAHAEEYD